MPATIEKLKETREIALRLNLGASAEARYLRALVVRLISDLVGDDVQHDDLAQSGALYPPPTLLPAAQPAPGPQAQLPVHAPFAPAAPPRRALTVEEALREAKARAMRGESTAVDATATKLNAPAVGADPPPAAPPLRIVPTAADVAAAAAPTQARPDPSVPDPAGAGFLEGLANDLDAEAEQPAG